MMSCVASGVSAWVWPTLSASPAMLVKVLNTWRIGDEMDVSFSATHVSRGCRTHVACILDCFVPVSGASNHRRRMADPG